MALERKDRVLDASTTTGTGTLTLTGSAPAGYRTFASAGLTTGATVRYSIALADNTEWEVGEGVWTSSGATLSRVTVYASSNSGSLVNFSAGTKAVALVMTAADTLLPGNGYAQNLTGAATTLTASYVDFLTASITTSRAGSRVALRAVVGVQKTSSTGNIDMKLLWNGSDVAERAISLSNGYAGEMSISAVVTGVSAGTHTAKVQLKYSTNGGTVGGTFYASALLADEQFA
jgi:hypothetical protein